MILHRYFARRFVLSFLAVFGIFILMTLGSQRDWLGTILGAILTFFIAKLVVRGVRGLVLEPMRRVCYRRVASRLCSQMPGGQVAVGPYSWTLGAPGAIAMTRAGELIIIERSHGYEPVNLLPHSRQFWIFQMRQTRSGRRTWTGFGASGSKLKLICGVCLKWQ